ncbi:MAG: hypothetical protein AAFZ49_12835 [Cyanobacteria bacterium J06659_2]
MTSKLSAAIRAGIHQLGISQGNLAENIGVSGNTVTSWVKDRHLPDKESLDELRRFFNWPEGKVAELLEDWFENGHGEKNYRIAGHEFVASKYGCDYEAFLADIIELDEATIAGISFEHEGTAEQWAPIFFHSPYTWRLIVRGDEIVGYWQFMCVKDDFYNDILRGSIVDSEILVEMLDFPVVEGRYKAYLPVIAVRAQDRGATTLGLLLSALNKTLEDFAKNDILIEDFCATAFSFEGRRLCELIGMKYMHRHPRAPAGSLADIFRITGKNVAGSYWGKKSRIIREKYRSCFRN